MSWEKSVCKPGEVGGHGACQVQGCKRVNRVAKVGGGVWGGDGRGEMTAFSRACVLCWQD